MFNGHSIPGSACLIAGAEHLDERCCAKFMVEEERAVEPVEDDFAHNSNYLAHDHEEDDSGSDDGPLAARSYLLNELAELLLWPPSPPAVSSRGTRLATESSSRNSKQVWRGKRNFRSGAIYKGEWQGQYRHGFGVQRWSDGVRYEGQWREGRAHGSGRFVHPNRGSYIGEWRSNRASGMGLYRDSDGSMTYRGEFFRDLPHGSGVERVASGAQYWGQFDSGSKAGFGVYVWADRTQYLGMWRNNANNGKGEFVSIKGHHFMGGWQDSVIHGIGRFRWPSGHEYTGAYMQDLKHGFGVFVWPDGRRFEGFWHLGQPQGEGMMTSREGWRRRAKLSTDKDRALLPSPSATVTTTSDTIHQDADAPLSTSAPSLAREAPPAGPPNAIPIPRFASASKIALQVESYQQRQQEGRCQSEQEATHQQRRLEGHRQNDQEAHQQRQLEGHRQNDQDGQNLLGRNREAGPPEKPGNRFFGKPGMLMRGEFQDDPGMELSSVGNDGVSKQRSPERELRREHLEQLLPHEQRKLIQQLR